MKDLRAVNETIIPIQPLVPNPIPSSPKCRGTPHISLIWTSKMHFSVFLYNQTLNIFLPLNEGTLIPEATQDAGTETLRGFGDGPYFFRKALAKELKRWGLEKGTPSGLLTAGASLLRSTSPGAHGLSGCSPQAQDLRLSSWARRLSCSAACGVFPDPGLNQCPLYWQADSYPLHHQGSPKYILPFWPW